MSVEHHQETRVVVAGKREAADPHVVIGPVITGIESGRPGQSLPQGPISIAMDVLPSNDADASRRLVQALRMQRGSLDYRHLLEKNRLVLIRNLGGLCHLRQSYKRYREPHHS